MKPSEFKWLSFSKIATTTALDNDALVAIEHIYGNLMIEIEAFHNDATMFLSDLATLTPTDSFVPKMLPPTSYKQWLS